MRETAKSENRLGLVNRIAVSIHHIAKFAGFCRVAFIFSEWKGRVVNRWYAAIDARCARPGPVHPVEPFENALPVSLGDAGTGEPSCHSMSAISWTVPSCHGIARSVSMSGAIAKSP